MAISTKMYELQTRFLEENLDVCLVQETYLKENSQESYIEGYATIRADRQAVQHGGLITFVKKLLIAEDQGSNAVNATEMLTFRIQLGKNKCVYAKENQ